MADVADEASPAVSVAEAEKVAKYEAEFTRTLERLWAAWLMEFDTDGSKTISLKELTAFASQPSYIASDSYMEMLYTWAKAALVCDLDPRCPPPRGWCSHSGPPRLPAPPRRRKTARWRRSSRRWTATGARVPGVLPDAQRRVTAGFPAS